MPNTRTTRTLLDWARDVSRTSAIMRVEPPETSTKELHEMIEAADAARHTTPELDEVEALAQAERDEPVVLSMYSSKWGDHERALLQALATRGYHLIRDFGVPASPAPEAVEALGSLSDYTCSHSPDRPWIFKDEALAALSAQREPARAADAARHTTPELDVLAFLRAKAYAYWSEESIKGNYAFHPNVFWAWLDEAAAYRDATREPAPADEGEETSDDD